MFLKIRLLKVISMAKVEDTTWSVSSACMAR